MAAKIIETVFKNNNLGVIIMEQLMNCEHSMMPKMEHSAGAKKSTSLILKWEKINNIVWFWIFFLLCFKSVRHSISNLNKVTLVDS